MWVSPFGMMAGLAVSLLAFFEQANDNGTPIWSSVLGPPFLHHGYYGFVLLTICMLVYLWVNRKR